MVILGGVAELSTESGHRDIEGFGWAVPVLIRDLAHEFLPTHGGAGVGSESGEQIELLGLSVSSSPLIRQRLEVRSIVSAPSWSTVSVAVETGCRRRCARRRASSTLRLNGLTR